MAIILKNSIYFKITRCGSEWIRTVLYKYANVVAEVKGTTAYTAMHIPRTTLSFTFVRHPVSWHQSLYELYKKRASEGKTDKNFPRMLSRINLEHFQAFVETFITLGPYYSNYVKAIADNVDFVGKQENLADDLITALSIAGEDFDEDGIRATPRMNESAHLERVDEHIAEFITDSYVDVIKEYGYDIH